MFPSTITPFQAALLATARIAGVAAIVACAPKQPVAAAPAPAPSADVPDPPATVASTEPATDFSTCEALTASVLEGVPYDAMFDESKRPKDVSPEVTSCCRLLLDEMNDGAPPTPVRARWGCCAVVEQPGIACAPWGPPSPPAFA